MKLPRPLEAMYAYPPARRPTGEYKAFAPFEPSAASKRLLSLYIHIPFCLHFCRFCGFVKSSHSNVASSSYVDLLCEEMDSLSAAFSNRELAAVYIGGGTPSTLRIDQIAKIFDSIRKNFKIAKDVETSFEGEVKTLRRENYLSDLRSLGVSRVSFGVQTMRADLRRLLNLRPSITQITEVAVEARSLFDDVCVDMMTGWPGLSLRQQIEDIEECIDELQPPSIELFRFELLDAEPSFARSLVAGVQYPIPFADLRRLDAEISDILFARGYRRVSYTIYRRAERSLRDLKYYGTYYGWDGGEILGVGVGAQSFVDGKMRGSVSTMAEYERLVRRGRSAVESFTPYDVLEKERATWPRRGYLSWDQIRRGPPAYQRKIKALIDAAILHCDDDVVRVAEWGLTEALMHYLLPAKVRNEYEVRARRRASDRGIAYRRETVHV